MRLGDLLRATPSLPARRRRKPPRTDAPRTIIPVLDEPAPSPLAAADLDAARDRLRREIPPLADDE